MGRRSCAYSANDMIDVDNGIIVDVEATTAIRQPRCWLVRLDARRAPKRKSPAAERCTTDPVYVQA
ncbi:hypothetical protein ACVIM7_001269 [Bradyrhizobium liaoningense]